MVFTEYTVVLGVCGLAAGLALYGLGVPLVQAYYLTKAMQNNLHQEVRELSNYIGGPYLS